MPRPLHSAPLVMNQPTTRCRCGKILCLNEQDARRIIRRIEKKKGHSNEVRLYECRYGSTHWTSQVHQQERAS